MSPRRIQPLDRAAVIAIVVLSLAITTLLLLGDHALARVRNFSWQGEKVGAEEVAFLLTFSRPMKPESVEQNLTIEPPLVGKFSWAGRRMAYTLETPAPYGQTFQVSLPQAQSRFNAAGDTSFEPFTGSFQSRDRGFVYIGIDGEEAGRLVLYDLTQQAKTILTPKEQVVLDFEPYRAGDRILFSAVSRADYEQGEQTQQLYTVTTGMGTTGMGTTGMGEPSPLPGWRFWQRPSALPAGETALVLDSQGYQNLKFDLSADGETVVIQRVNRTNPADFGPWVLHADQPPRPLETDPGGDFLIAPDSQTLLLQQGEGTAVIGLDTLTTEQVGPVEPLDFLPEYGLVLDVASNGTAAALVNFNQNDPEQRYTQTLFWVSSQGEEKPLLNATGAILDAQFDPTDELLYCLISQLLPGENYQVQPYLMVVNISTGELQELLAMPPQPNVSMSLAPDGLAVLFDEAVTVSEGSQSTGGATGEGRAVSSSRLWLLPLFATPEERLANQPSQLPPQQLPFTGLRPVWLP